MFAGFWMTLGQVLFLFLAVFLILIVLIQRGKGGGLSGAFGGMGGSSAFGTKTTDVLLKITIGVAASWIILAMILTRTMSRGTSEARFPSAPTADEFQTPDFPLGQTPQTDAETDADVEPGSTPAGGVPEASRPPTEEGSTTESGQTEESP